MNKTAYTVLRRMLPLVGMLLCYVAVGQNVTVQGRVVDQTGEAIPGANVLVKGTTNGTLTDADGNYSLTVPNRNSTLVFSFLGYQTQELSADGRSMTVTMHEALACCSSRCPKDPCRRSASVSIRWMNSDARSSRSARSRYSTCVIQRSGFA